jgi:hypothetical protein
MGRYKVEMQSYNTNNTAIKITFNAVRLLIIFCIAYAKLSFFFTKNKFFLDVKMKCAVLML